MGLLKSIPWVFIFVLSAHAVCLSQSNVYDTLRTVRMTAQADHQTTSLTIQWKDDPESNTYSLYKKLGQDTTWGSPLIITGDQDTSYLDVNIQAGELYEYRIIKQTGDSLGYAYLFSGVDYIPAQRRGDILLLVDSMATDVIEDNLTSYTNILISEGWIPWVVSVSADASVQEVKSRILQYYGNVDSLTTVLLLGNIAIPHSGDIKPDTHNNHKGAWPADVYYGDVDGIWTDQTVNNTSSDYPRIHNVPGDGKFDQGYIPGEIELVIGRLDFSELPVFSLNEYELLNNYLQKNIAYRTGEYRPRRRAFLKNTSTWKEGSGQNAIRNFVPLVSSDSLIVSNNFTSTFNANNSYLWMYGAGSGSMVSASGLGTINTYVNSSLQITFTGYLGSYYGDYDFENNFLRTVLASGRVLSTAWIGAPNWYFHPMGMGMDLGFCTLLTQNNTDLYYAGLYPQSVTINLLGDPSLKAFIVGPPRDLTAVLQSETQVRLSWSPSEDNILGYQVYKKPEGADYFEAINLIPVSDTSLVDTCCMAGPEEIEYLVKAVKREITPSGSFINHSTGPIISVNTNPVLSAELIAFSAEAKTQAINLFWTTATEQNHESFVIERKTDVNSFERIGTVPAIGTSIIPSEYEYIDEQVIPGITYYYRLKEIAANGSTEYSETVSAKIELSDIFVGISPNPVGKSAQLIINSPAEISTTVIILDTSGRMVRQLPVNLSTGTNLIDLDVTDLQSGVYFIQLEGLKSVRFVKM